MKIKIVKNGTIKPAAPFKTLEKEAKYWDAHPTTKIVKNSITFHKANKSDTITIRFEPKHLEAIKSSAHRLGIGPTTLARMWIMEKLQITT